jgi:protein TonB
MNRLATPHPHPRATPSLGWFVSLSLLLHLGLLWGFTPTPTSIPPDAAQTPTPTLAVRLQQRGTPPPTITTPIPTPAQPEPAALNPIVKQKPQPKTTHTATKSKPLDTVQQTETPHTPDNTATTTTAIHHNDAALRERLKVTLQQALAENFRYPLLARRRGWQGEVLLAFRIEADGSILDARIARSSGYGVLDNAALSALGKVKRLHRDTPRSLTIQLPVIYRLEG